MYWISVSTVSSSSLPPRVERPLRVGAIQVALVESRSGHRCGARARAVRGPLASGAPVLPRLAFLAPLRRPDPARVVQGAGRRGRRSQG